MSVMLASLKGFDSVPSLSISWKIWKSIGVSFSLKVLQNLAVNLSGLELLFMGEFLFLLQLNCM
jgi:hypothetical protein